MISVSSVLQGAASSILTAISSNNHFNATPILYIPMISPGAYSPIRLDNSAYKVSAQAAISTQVLVSINSDGTTTKQYITDNVAPGPRTWVISGWISDNDVTSALFNPVNQIGLSVSVRSQVNQLWAFFYTRGLAKFRDKDGNLWPNVAIESMDFDADPATQNKAPISITIREVNVLALDSNGISTTAISNDPTSVYSPPDDMGMALNAVIQDPTSVLNQVLVS